MSLEEYLEKVVTKYAGIGGCIVQGFTVEEKRDDAGKELAGLLYDEKGNRRSGPFEKVVLGGRKPVGGEWTYNYGLGHETKTERGTFVYTTEGAIGRVNDLLSELETYITACGKDGKLRAEMDGYQKLKDALKTNDRDKIWKAVNEIPG